MIAAAGFEPGQRVRIVDQPRSTWHAYGGREGWFIGPNARWPDHVTVELESGDYRVPNVSLMVKQTDLEAA